MRYADIVTKKIAKQALAISIAAGLGLSGCGGGGGGGALSSISSSINVIDGYVQGAIVFLDKNKNGVKDANEPVAINTDPANGVYTFKGISAATLKQYPVVVTVPVGAVDMDNPNQPITNAFNMTAPAGTTSGVVSPITSLIHSQMKNNPGMTIAEAQTTIKKAMGLPANSTVDLTANYVAKNNANNAKIHKVAQTVAAIVGSNQAKLQSNKPKGASTATLVDVMVQQAIASLPTIVLKVDSAGAKFNPKTTPKAIAANKQFTIPVNTLKKKLAAQQAKLSKPRIKLIGNPVITLVAKKGATYADPGAKAASNTYGDISASIKATGTVNASKPGKYTITYNVTDAKGNKAKPVTRRINVIANPDKTAPVIQLIGANKVTMQAGVAPYVEQGAIATDNADGDISTSIQTTGTVNAAKPGTYTIAYNVSDAAGNKAKTVTRTITVTAPPKDTTPPHIVLNLPPVKGPVKNTAALDPTTIVLITGTKFTDPGASAWDAVDGTVTVKKTGIVNTAKAGTYTITYTATDKALNKATATRTVIVTAAADKTAPVITLLGQKAVTIKQGATYSDAGATATDNVDGNITKKIKLSNPVDTSLPGVYTVTYNVSDHAGNAATQVTRTVTVTKAADTTPPTITLVGNKTISVVQNTTFNDPGVTAYDTVDGDLTANVAATSAVNTAKLGTYTITYKVSDKAGNPATPATRTVKVIANPSLIDNIPPVVIAPKDIIVEATGTMTAVTLGTATVTDNISKALTATPDQTGPFSLGTHIITWTAKDAVGNSGFALQQITVHDTTKPLMAVASLPPVSATTTGTTATVPLTAPKATDALLVGVTSNAPTVFPVGKTIVTWTAVDTSGNTATLSQTVTVKDAGAPVIQLNGQSTMVLSKGQAFKDPGSIVTDNIDKGLKSTVTGNVKTTIPGTYTLTYTATDKAGNKASPVVRTVIVNAGGIAVGAPKAGTLASFFTGGNSMAFLDVPNQNTFTYDAMSWSGKNGAPMTDMNFTWDPATNTFKSSTKPKYIEYRLQPSGQWLAVDTNAFTPIDQGTAGVLSLNSDGSSTTTKLTSTKSLAGLNIKKILAAQKNGAGAQFASLVNPTATFSTNAQQITLSDTQNQSVYRIGKFNDQNCTAVGSTKNCNVAGFFDQTNQKQINPTTLAQILSTPNQTLPTGNGKAIAYKDIFFADGMNSQFSVTLGATNATSTTGEARIYSNKNGGWGAYNWGQFDQFGNPTLNTPVAVTTWSMVAVNGVKMIQIAVPKAVKLSPWMQNVSKIGFAVQDNYVRKVDIIAKGAVGSPGTGFNKVAMADIKANFSSKYDKTAPMIQLFGAKSITVQQNSAFVDPGSIVTDNFDTGLKAVVTGTVTTTTAGTYTLTYNATDSAGNKASPVTRTVVVVAAPAAANGAIANNNVPGLPADTTPPTITLNGMVNFNAPLNQTGAVITYVKQGSTFVDPGSQVSDNVSTGLKATVTGTVNTAKVGTYKLTYNAVDTAGNKATPVVRIVNVIAAGTPVAKPGLTSSYITAGNILANLDAFGYVSMYGYNTISWDGVSGTPISQNYYAWNPATGLFNAAPANNSQFGGYQGDYHLQANGQWTLVDTNKFKLTDKGAAGVVSTYSDGSSDTNVVTGATDLAGVSIKGFLAASGLMTAQSAWSDLIDPAAKFTTGAQQIHMSHTQNQTIYRISVWNDPTCPGTTHNCNTASFWSQSLNQQIDPTQLGQVLNIVGQSQGNGQPAASVPTYYDIYFADGVNGIPYTVTLLASSATASSGQALIFGDSTNGNYGAYTYDNMGNQILNKPAATTTWSRTIVNGVPMIHIAIPKSIKLAPYMSNVSSIDFAVQDGYVRPVEVITKGATSSDSSFNGLALSEITASFSKKFDKTPPMINLMGPANMSVTQNSTFVDPGSVVYDNIDTTLKATVTGAVNTAAVGTYKLTYNATDSAGNKAQPVIRTVTVQAAVTGNNGVATDLIAPTIQLNGANPLIIRQGVQFADPGSLVFDNVDQGLIASVTGKVNTAKVGAYKLTYNAVDTAGNKATPVIRTVQVVSNGTAVANPGTLASYFANGKSLSYLDSPDGFSLNYGSVTWKGVNGTAPTFTTYAWNPSTGKFATTTATNGIQFRLQANGTWLPRDSQKILVTDKGAAGVLITYADGSSGISALSSVKSLTGIKIKQYLTAGNNPSQVWSALMNPTATFTKGAQAVAMTETPNQTDYLIAQYVYPGCTPLGTTKNCNVAGYWDQNMQQQVNPTQLSQILSLKGQTAWGMNGVVPAYNDIYFANTADQSGSFVRLMAINPSDTSGKADIYSWNNPRKPLATSTWNLVVVNGVSMIKVSIPKGMQLSQWMQGTSAIAYAVQDGYVRQAIVHPKGVAYAPNVNFNSVAMTDIKANISAKFDKVAPSIQLVGSSTMTVALNGTFTDPGTVVTDNLLSGLKASVTGTVNTSVAGTYTLTYSVTDTAGNKAQPVTRTVIVQ